MFEIGCFIAFLATWGCAWVYQRSYIFRLLNKGEVIFKDEPGAQVIVDREFMVSAKPDRVVRYRGKNVVLEFKSRKKGIFEKDLVQALAGGLAVWDLCGGIHEILVYNGSYRFKRIRLSSKQRLYSRLKKHIKVAQKVKSGGKVWVWPTRRKCKTCPYSQNCRWAR